MALLEKQLVVKRSVIPGAGKGLFTKKEIPRGKRICEYKGKRTSWKDVAWVGNGYIYYINRHHVLDARELRNGFAHYANDAKGLVKSSGFPNNAKYTIDKERVYIEAMRDIPAGGEILVGYGKEYWDAIRFNLKLNKKK